jgi:hypothetical protein
MLSTTILEALENLHRELAQLEPAIKHIQAAQKVTEEAKALPKLQLKLLDDIRQADQDHKEGLKGILEKEIVLLNTSQLLLTESANKVVKSVSADIERLNELIKTINVFHRKVEEIDFPERLQSIEKVSKETVQQVEQSRKLMADELTQLLKDVHAIDIKGSLVIIKQLVTDVAQSSNAVVESIKAENLGTLMKEGTQALLMQIDTNSLDLRKSTELHLDKVLAVLEEQVLGDKLKILETTLNQRLATLDKKADARQTTLIMLIVAMIIICIVGFVVLFSKS